ncbi:creatininase [Halobellus rarus]|uniref:Creatininase n=2 Tax=Halobellus rarus TaxID=1126237 RepID=A0ABD6CRQ6_9EURY|nr:creatininase [Halobellus rarus]
MTWKEYDQRVERVPVFIPVGSTEQHGPGLPMNVDSVIPTEFSERTAERVDGIVAPTIHYGAKSQPGSGGGSEFVGTTSVHGGTLRRQIQDVIGDLERDGARKIVFFNGHYENEYPIREAIDRHIEDGTRATFIIASWWDLLSPSLRDEIFEEIPGGFPGWAKEHAGVIETALMRHFRPELVREDEIVDDEADRTPSHIVKPAPTSAVPDSGVFYRATYGTADVGRRVVENVTDTLVSAIEKEFA